MGRFLRVFLVAILGFSGLAFAEQFNTNDGANYKTSDSAFKFYWDPTTDTLKVYSSAIGTAGNPITWIEGFTMDVTGTSLFQVGADAGACTAAKEGRLRYVDASNRVELCDDLSWIVISGGRYALADGATITVDWNNGNTQYVTLAGNRIMSFSNGQDGARYTLILIQDGTGSRTITNWSGGGTVRWPGGTAPTLTTTASKSDYIGFIYNGSSSTYDGVAISQNY